MSFMQKKYIETVQKIYLSNKLFAGAARLVVSLALFLLWSNLRNPFMKFVISPCGGEGRDRFRLIKTEKETKI